MGGGKGGGSRTIYDFYMSMDYGICHGPLDAINSIEMRDKLAFRGPAEADGSAYLNKKKLFGGDDGEGGPRGTVEFYLGGFAQKMSADLADRYDLTSDTAPGYRGVAHLFFRGGKTGDGGDAPDGSVLSKLFGSAYELLTGVASGRSGFLWSSNNPYLQAPLVNATRSSVGLDASALIWPITGVDENGDFTVASDGDAFLEDGKIDKTKLPDANPAAMIYECMTSYDWGKGEPGAAMNKDSYEACASVLANEHFGLSMRWMQQDSIENFVSEIQDHIKAFHFQHPKTGLWTLKLVRDDYVAADALLLDPSNCDAHNIKTTLWDDTINLVRVSYTDPRSEEAETVEAQNLASIAVQGGVRPDTRDYHGIRNPWLAKTVAERDVAEASRPLTSAVVYASREAEDLAPGDVVRFSWPEENLSEMVMRVLSLNPGKSSDRRIKLELIEDIFSVQRAQVEIEPQPPTFVDVDPAPQDPDQVFIMSPPMPVLIRRGIDPGSFDAAYPRSAVGFLVNDEDFTPIDISAYGDIVRQNGATDQDIFATFLPTRNVALGQALTPEVRSTIPGSLIETVERADGVPGALYVIGDAEGNHELVMLDTYDEGDDEWTIVRGAHDTIPETWTSDVLFWRLAPGLANADPRERLAGDEVGYKFLTRTRLGSLDPADATEHNFTVGGRPSAPHRPADVEIDDNGFAAVQYLSGSVPTDVTVSWANRNRLGEDAIIPAWDDANATPEVGQTTTIRFRDAIGGVLDHEVTGLSGTSEVVDIDDFPTYRFYDVEVLSVRDGIESFRVVSRSLELERLGYGNNYGFDYGTNDTNIFVVDDVFAMADFFEEYPE